VRTVEIEDPGPLIALLPATGCSAWLRDGDGVVGWGEAALWTGWGADRFDRARDWLGGIAERRTELDDVRLPGTGLISFGAFGYGADAPDSERGLDAGDGDAPKPAGHGPAGSRDGTLRPSVLRVPAVVVGHRDGRWWLTTAQRLSPDERAGAEHRAGAADGIAAAIRTLLRPASPMRPIGPLTWRDGACSGPQWSEAVARAVAAIRARDADKVVLARDVIAEAAGPIDPRTILARLADRYPSCWTFAVDGLVGATPEMLVRLEGGLAESRVLAGTIRRDPASDSAPDANEEDARLGAALMNSAKDRQEHAFSVRSVVERLAPLCLDLDAPATPDVLSLPNVLHLSSDVRAHVAAGATALQLAAALHPTAAVCGAPRDAAESLISSLEPMRRGRYAGPVGWQGANGDGEWGIALRCGELDARDDRRIRLFAGAGIVSASDPVAELAETDAKLRPMRDALGPGLNGVFR
jgi:menaquinone-specific isochorismate synthase